ncbi:hypothetical protein BGZ61DRAFT_475090 [Ilyonectria robusta]|uniref:uncharacterized protein n=1 Tax=Ilyonectria robusta TaxID=1079257 RepID=UPI001E8D22F7|nr:uncharacterized protein BGZ61DRAFT_475090 [Ilyonectria robusta]KAH8729473.1 hypothetical protein BGZ61DRAFT_475090 [Ilyonectria robusta]
MGVSRPFSEEGPDDDASALTSSSPPTTSLSLTPQKCCCSDDSNALLSSKVCDVLREGSSIRKSYGRSERTYKRRIHAPSIHALSQDYLYAGHLTTASWDAYQVPRSQYHLENAQQDKTPKACFASTLNLVGIRGTQQAGSDSALTPGYSLNLCGRKWMCNDNGGVVLLYFKAAGVPKDLEDSLCPPSTSAPPPLRGRRGFSEEIAHSNFDGFFEINVLKSVT